MPLPYTFTGEHVHRPGSLNPPLNLPFSLQICQLSSQGGSIKLQQLQENVIQKMTYVYNTSSGTGNVMVSYETTIFFI